MTDFVQLSGYPTTLQAASCVIAPGHYSFANGIHLDALPDTAWGPGQAARRLSKGARTGRYASAKPAQILRACAKAEQAMNTLLNPTMNRNVRAIARLAARCAWLFFAGACAHAQPAQMQQRSSTPGNQASQRYEINQTFDGRAFYKDNNVWVYTKDFADLFGMPAKYVEDVQGIAAAAFRIEDTSYQQCGFAGRVDACRKVEQCLIDLYFDESKTPLPWADDTKSQWLPWYSSMRWLRTGRPNPAHRAEVPVGIIPNDTLQGALVPFADPVSKREAIFTSNTWVSGDDEAVARSMAIIGYTRDFYKTLSVVNLQFGCGSFVRKQVNIRLDAKKSGAFEPPIARFNRVVLPEAFVQRVKDLQKAQSDKNAVFYRSLFAPPLGTRGTATAPSAANK